MGGRTCRQCLDRSLPAILNFLAKILLCLVQARPFLLTQLVLLTARLASDEKQTKTRKDQDAYQKGRNEPESESLVRSCVSHPGGSSAQGVVWPKLTTSVVRAPAKASG